MFTRAHFCPDKSSQRPHTLFLRAYYYTSIYAFVSHLILNPLAFLTIVLYTLFIPLTRATGKTFILLPNLITRIT
jgi:uncharacterized membrane protein YdbT with pleckstrin-like domain